MGLILFRPLTILWFTTAFHSCLHDVSVIIRQSLSFAKGTWMKNENRNTAVCSGERCLDSCLLVFLAARLKEKVLWTGVVRFPPHQENLRFSRIQNHLHWLFVVQLKISEQLVWVRLSPGVPKFFKSTRIRRSLFKIT